MVVPVETAARVAWEEMAEKGVVAARRGEKPGVPEVAAKVETAVGVVTAGVVAVAAAARPTASSSRPQKRSLRTRSRIQRFASWVPGDWVEAAVFRWEIQATLEPTGPQRTWDRACNSGDGDVLAQVDVLNRVQQFNTLIHRFLEGFSAADESHPTGSLVDDSGFHGLGQVISP